MPRVKARSVTGSGRGPEGIQHGCAACEGTLCATYSLGAASMSFQKRSHSAGGTCLSVHSCAGVRFQAWRMIVIVAIVRNLLAHVDVAHLEHLRRRKQRLFAKIVFGDDVEVRGQSAVIREVRPEAVGHRERTLAHAREQPRHAVAARRIERDRIKQRRGHAPQHNIDRLDATNRLEVKPAVEHDKIVPLHDGHAHLPGQRRVVEIIFVAAALREQHPARAALGNAHQFQQHVEHLCREVLDRQNFHSVKKPRRDLPQNLPLLQRVARAVGDAQVFLDDHPLPARVLLEVERGELQVCCRHARQARATAMKIRVRVDDLVRHDARLQDLLAAVDIAQEKIPRAHALRQAHLDPRPILAGNHQRHQVEAAVGTVLLRRKLLRRNVGRLPRRAVPPPARKCARVFPAAARSAISAGAARVAEGNRLGPESLGLRLRVAQGNFMGGETRTGHDLTSCPTGAFGARAYRPHFGSVSSFLSTLSFAFCASTLALSASVVASSLIFSAAGRRNVWPRYP